MSLKTPNRPEYDVEDGGGVSTMTAAEREKRRLGLTQESWICIERWASLA
jgi:hypothetical protein